jgi:hypothetical protein
MVMKDTSKPEMGLQKELKCKNLQNYFSFISYGFTNPMPSVSDGIL